MYGSGNSGPRTEVWVVGDRVRHFAEYTAIGTVVSPPRDPDASETQCVYVCWDDGQSGYCDPNSLTVI